MKTTGRILISPLMSQMQVGQSGFLHADAIIVVDNKIFIDTSFSVLEVKNDKHLLPIKKIGIGKEDYEIDFNVTHYFCNIKLNKKEIEDLKNGSIVGPYNIEIEIYTPLKYQEQIYPRMDLEGLIDVFVANNMLIESEEETESSLNDKKKLKQLIIEKLKILSLATLKTYENIFSPLSIEDSNDGEIINYAEDRDICTFITRLIQRLKSQQKLKDLTIPELETELKISDTNEDYERSSHIAELINIKKTALH